MEGLIRRTNAGNKQWVTELDYREFAHVAQVDDMTSDIENSEHEWKAIHYTE
jgi:hypothetical protein